MRYNMVRIQSVPAASQMCFSNASTAPKITDTHASPEPSGRAVKAIKAVLWWGLGGTVESTQTG